MREQQTKVYTENTKRKLWVAVVVLIVIGVAALFAFFYYRSKNPVYTPPKFDASAQGGVPAPDEAMGYSDITADGGFSFSMVGVMYQQEDGSLQLYFTNPEDSGVNMQCEVTDADGQLLYQSGAVRPGEYVKELKPQRKLENVATDITVNVYAFEPDTWYSKGTITLQNVLQPY